MYGFKKKKSFVKWLLCLGWFLCHMIQRYYCGFRWIWLIRLVVDWFGLVWIGLDWCGLVNQFWNWKWFCVIFWWILGWHPQHGLVGDLISSLKEFWRIEHIAIEPVWFLRHRMQRHMCNIMMQNDAIIFTCSCVIGCNNIIADWWEFVLVAACSITKEWKCFCFLCKTLKRRNSKLIVFIHKFIKIASQDTMFGLIYIEFHWSTGNYVHVCTLQLTALVSVKICTQRGFWNI